jgi:hypothetical protein
VQAHREVLQEARHRPGSVHARREPRDGRRRRRDHQRPDRHAPRRQEILVYHPNSVGDGRDGASWTRAATAGIHLDLSGSYQGTYKASGCARSTASRRKGPTVQGGVGDSTSPPPGTAATSCCGSWKPLAASRASGRASS